MTRNGTVTLLGAGASVEAGYPTAEGFLDLFREAVHKATESEVTRREQLRLYRSQVEQQGGFSPEPLPQPTTGEWFDEKWKAFEGASARLRPLAVPELKPDGRPDLPSPVVYGPSGMPTFPPYPAPKEDQAPSPAPTPYLETFFAFYDECMRPIIASAQGDPGALRTMQWRFRDLRELAVQTVYRAFSPYGTTAASYLRPLLGIRGPGRLASAIATLNFDVTVEQIASEFGIDLWDGFATTSAKFRALPAEWSEPLSQLWDAVTQNCHEFIGLGAIPESANLLLKLHGSLGWYVLEEGGGEIGYRDDLRHNVAYTYFRLPYDALWRSETEQMRRKAGTVWVRPYLVFARALKTPDRLSRELLSAFVRLLDEAAAVLVVGYSWGDPHVNDVIFDAVARGANLVNISKSAAPTYTLALWRQRFPTTYQILRKRLFMFGGGARKVFQDHVLELPSGESRPFDLAASIPQGLPAEFSLEVQDELEKAYREAGFHPPTTSL